MKSNTILFYIHATIEKFLISKQHSSFKYLNRLYKLKKYIFTFLSSIIFYMCNIGFPKQDYSIFI